MESSFSQAVFRVDIRDNITTLRSDRLCGTSRRRREHRTSGPCVVLWSILAELTDVGGNDSERAVRYVSTRDLPGRVWRDVARIHHEPDDVGVLRTGTAGAGTVLVCRGQCRSGIHGRGQPSRVRSLEPRAPDVDGFHRARPVHEGTGQGAARSGAERADRGTVDPSPGR